MFEDIMDEGIELSKTAIKTETMQKSYPAYLSVTKVVRLTLDSRVDPSGLFGNCAYIYKDNLYITDEKGNPAYVDCEMTYTKKAAEIKRKHPEYKRTGGKSAKHENMDAGHFGVQLGQHPSISMEQDATMNRYGTWRKFERNWLNLIKEGHRVNVRAVFVEGDTEGSFSPFWCISETIDNEERNEYALLNEPNQF